MDLKGNTILITGGTSGFGLEFTKQLIGLGNTVIITGRDQAKLDQTKKDLPAVHIFRSDVADADAIVRLYQQVTARFPQLNMLINNAGEMRIINLNDASLSLTDITREIEINLMGPIRMIQQFLPHLTQQKTAAILNVTSGLALIPFPLSPVYGATKAGLHSYTQSLRIQLGNTAVKVFELLAPSANTPLGDKFASVDGYNASMNMAPEKVVDAAIKGLSGDKLEIYPGFAKVIRIMSRLAPGVLLSQTSKAGKQLWSAK